MVHADERAARTGGRKAGLHFLRGVREKRFIVGFVRTQEIGVTLIMSPFEAGDEGEAQ